MINVSCDLTETYSLAKLPYCGTLCRAEQASTGVRSTQDCPATCLVYWMLSCMAMRHMLML